MRRHRRRARFTRDDVLACVLVATIWIAFWLYVGCRAFGVWAAPAPDFRVRDGVHTAAVEETEPETEPETLYDLSPEDADLLCRVALAEAGYRDAYSQACVMQVIMNRVNDPRFPDTVSGVVYQPHQFSTAGYLNRYDPADAAEGLAMLQSGQATHTALAFCTTSFSWATYVFSVGGNNYFTF